MSRRGAALAETALLLPVLLGLALGVAQLALLAQARVLVQAAAVSAARAAIADPSGTRLSPGRAAAAACAPLSGAAAAALKTSARVGLGRDETEALVEHHLELLVPVAGTLFVRMERSWGLLPGSRRRALEAHALRNRALSELYREPHVRILARARLPAPWLEARRKGKG